MIRSVKYLSRFAIVATDGEIGAVDDFYFDDERWAIRYIVVDTGKWLSGRRALVSPISVTRVEWGNQQMKLGITREQVRNSPGIDTHQPVSRRQEQVYYDYYRYPYYWAAPGLWGAYATPMMPTPEEAARADAVAAANQRQAEARGDANLRSASEVNGYAIGAADGELGHVDDLLFDDVSWAVRYIVVDTRTWWSGKHVLVAPEWISEISWERRAVQVRVNRESLRNAPEYDRAAHVDRQWEAAYYQHVAEPGYWLDADQARTIKSAQDYLRD